MNLALFAQFGIVPEPLCDDWQVHEVDFDLVHHPKADRRDWSYVAVGGALVRGETVVTVPPQGYFMGEYTTPLRATPEVKIIIELCTLQFSAVKRVWMADSAIERDAMRAILLALKIHALSPYHAGFGPEWAEVAEEVFEEADLIGVANPVLEAYRRAQARHAVLLRRCPHVA